MGRKLQQPGESIAIGNAIEEERRRRSITLDQLSAMTGVNKGQLSRFCAGQFKTVSKNLQQVLDFLQLVEQPGDPKVDTIPPEVLEQLGRSWARAGSRRGALVAAIVAIEQLLD